VTECSTSLQFAQALRFEADGPQMHEDSFLMQVTSKQRGFSLVEAVVLVCLMGILIAFALPRFTRVAHSARASEVVALTASLRHAAEAAHVQYLATGERHSSVSVDHKTIRLRNGYPDASASGIRNAVFDLEGFTIRSTDNAVIFAKSDAPAAERCSVTYHAAPEPADTAIVSGLDTSGC
jgi:type II secretory pathway pseudopilin PulG